MIYKFDKFFEKLNNTEVRSLSDIALDIENDWKNLSVHAKPYLMAMFSLDKITDKYGMDSGDSIVAYFLSNATTWRGETAKKIKLELNTMLKNNRRK